MAESLHRRTQRSPVRVRPVPPPRLRRHDERPRFMVSGYWVSIPMQKTRPPGICSYGLVRNRDQYASVRGGFLSLFPAAYGVHSPADAPALTSQGSDFLSPFPQPGGSRAHGRRSSAGRAAVCKTVSAAGSNPAPTSRGAYAPSLPEVGIS